MNFGLDQAREALNRGMEEAQEIIRNPSKVDDILVQLEEKLKAVPVIGSTLSDVPLMVSMIKAWIKKEYTVVSPKVIACLVGAVVYLIRKKDLISDSVPIVGHVDDLAVLGLALKLSEKELKAFSEWRSAQRSSGTVMSELGMNRRGEDWSDEIPDPEEDGPEPYEETYRDGSARNECWPERES